MSAERVTVTLPVELIEGIDRLEGNRSRFISEAVEHELALRRRNALLRSLENPHAETGELAAVGLSDWAARLPSGDDDLVDISSGKAVRWVVSAASSAE